MRNRARNLAPRGLTGPGYAPEHLHRLVSLITALCIAGWQVSAMGAKKELMSASSIGKVGGELRAVPFKAPKTIQEPSPLFYGETYAHERSVRS